MAKQNLNENVEEVKVEDGEIGGEETMKNKKINWKLLMKCTAGVVLVGAASVALYKWRKSKKVSSAVVVTTPCEPNNSSDSQVGSSTLVEI